MRVTTIMYTRDAAVRFRPMPPAFSEIRKTVVWLSVWKEWMAVLRWDGFIEPSNRTYWIELSLNSTSIRLKKLVNCENTKDFSPGGASLMACTSARILLEEPVLSSTSLGVSGPLGGGSISCDSRSGFRHSGQAGLIFKACSAQSRQNTWAHGVMQHVSESILSRQMEHSSSRLSSRIRFTIL